MKCIEVFLLIPVFIGFGNTPRALVELSVLLSYTRVLKILTLINYFDCI